MKKLRIQELNQLVQGCTVIKWWSRIKIQAKLLQILCSQMLFSLKHLSEGEADSSLVPDADGEASEGLTQSYAMYYLLTKPCQLCYLKTFKGFI